MFTTQSDIPGLVVETPKFVESADLARALAPEIIAANICAASPLSSRRKLPLGKLRKGRGIDNLRARVICAVLIFSATASAEQSPEFDFLTKEPATLLDVGMYRLNSYLERIKCDVYPRLHKEKCDEFSLESKYSALEDKITIDADCFHCDVDVTGEESWCNEIIKQLRRGTIDDRGNVMYPRQHSVYTEGFHHEDDTSMEPNKQNSDEIIMMHINIRVLISGTDKNYLECDAPLVGKGFSVQRP